MIGKLRDLVVGVGYLTFAMAKRLQTGRWRSDARERNGRVGVLPRPALPARGFSCMG